MALMAVGTKVIVQRDAKQEPEAGGLLLPDEVRKPPRTGTVLSVGPQVSYDIQVNDKVYFHEYAGCYLKDNQDLDETDLLSLGEDEVLAVEREE